jgi:glycosyltransferase involved in cell wall biosynthesis
MELPEVNSSDPKSSNKQNWFNRCKVIADLYHFGIYNHHSSKHFVDKQTFPEIGSCALILEARKALASGVPVVQPDHGAFPELIQRTGGGQLCTPDDPAALAQALETLLLDESQRDQLAKNAIASARREFTATTMAERFDSLLRELT